MPYVEIGVCVFDNLFCVFINLFCEYANDNFSATPYI